jgi:hypothetical protein
VLRLWFVRSGWVLHRHRFVSEVRPLFTQRSQSVAQRALRLFNAGQGRVPVIRNVGIRLPLALNFGFLGE